MRSFNVLDNNRHSSISTTEAIVTLGLSNFLELNERAKNLGKKTYIAMIVLLVHISARETV